MIFRYLQSTYVNIRRFFYPSTWWRHQMETFSALLAICVGNSPVPGEFPTQRPVTRSFDVFFDLRPNKRLSKQSWGWWSETPSSSLWRHRNESNCRFGNTKRRIIHYHLFLNFSIVITNYVFIVYTSMCLCYVSLSQTFITWWCKQCAVIFLALHIAVLETPIRYRGIPDCIMMKSPGDHFTSIC